MRGCRQPFFRTSRCPKVMKASWREFRTAHHRLAECLAERADGRGTPGSARPLPSARLLLVNGTVLEGITTSRARVPQLTRFEEARDRGFAVWTRHDLCCAIDDPLSGSPTPLDPRRLTLGTHDRFSVAGRGLRAARHLAARKRKRHECQQSRPTEQHLEESHRKLLSLLRHCALHRARPVDVKTPPTRTCLRA